MLSNDPVIKEVMRLLGIPPDVTGFTVSASVDSLVKVSIDAVVRKAPDGSGRFTGLDSAAHEYAAIPKIDTLGQDAEA